MVENLLERAKNFIGLGEGVVISGEATRQVDFGSSERHERRRANSEEGEYEIVIYEPKVYEDSLTISQHLRSGSPVIISLRHLEPAEGTRLIDFVCGTAYAIDGHMLKIADAIFLFTPNHILISDIEGKAALNAQFDEPSDNGKFFSRK